MLLILTSQSNLPGHALFGGHATVLPQLLFGCGSCVERCAGYFLADRCRLTFLSLPCLHRQAKSALGQTTSLSLLPPIPRVINVFLPRLSFSSFSPGSSAAAEQSLCILSEFIHLRYLYSPPVMTDSRQTVLSSPFHSQHLPTSLQPLYTTYGRTLHSQLQSYYTESCSQNNPSCCIYR